MTSENINIIQRLYFITTFSYFGFESSRHNIIKPPKISDPVQCQTMTFPHDTVVHPMAKIFLFPTHTPFRGGLVPTTPHSWIRLITICSKDNTYHFLPSKAFLLLLRTSFVTSPWAIEGDQACSLHQDSSTCPPHGPPASVLHQHQGVGGGLLRGASTLFNKVFSLGLVFQ